MNILLTLLVFILYYIHSDSALSSKPTTVVVAGATGYIGRQVVKELVSRNINCISLVRSTSNIPIKTSECLQKSQIIECNIQDPNEIHTLYKEHLPTITINCLGSRSGVKRESWAIDYEAGKNILKAQESIATVLQESSITNSNSNTNHYVLLSAFCCAKPILQYHFAKLKLEEEIKHTCANSKDSFTYSIVRPTAYFKSLDGQIESAQKGNPLLYFGDGSCSANAISDDDLAKYLVDCAVKPQEISMLNKCQVIGGPDNPPIPKREQLELIYNVLDIPIEKRRMISLPIAVIDVLIKVFNTIEYMATKLHMPSTQERFEDAAEIARIVRYYATEPMVAVESGQIQGKTKLIDHFTNIAKQGGNLDEINKMVTTTGILNAFTNNDYT